MTGEPPAPSAVPEPGSRPHFCISWRKCATHALDLVSKIGRHPASSSFFVLLAKPVFCRQVSIVLWTMELAVLAAPFRGYVDVDCSADILAEFRGVPVAGRIHATAELETPDVHGLTVRRGNSSHYQRDCKSQPHVRLPLLVPRCSGLQSSSDLLARYPSFLLRLDGLAIGAYRSRSRLPCTPSGDATGTLPQTQRGSGPGHRDCQ